MPIPKAIDWLILGHPRHRERHLILIRVSHAANRDRHQRVIRWPEAGGAGVGEPTGGGHGHDGRRDTHAPYRDNRRWTSGCKACPESVPSWVDLLAQKSPVSSFNAYNDAVTRLIPYLGPGEGGDLRGWVIGRAGKSLGITEVARKGRKGRKGSDDTIDSTTFSPSRSRPGTLSKMQAGKPIGDSTRGMGIVFQREIERHIEERLFTLIRKLEEDGLPLLQQGPTREPFHDGEEVQLPTKLPSRPPHGSVGRREDGVAEQRAGQGRPQRMQVGWGGASDKRIPLGRPIRRPQGKLGDVE